MNKTFGKTGEKILSFYYCRMLFFPNTDVPDGKYFAAIMGIIYIISGKVSANYMQIEEGKTKDANVADVYIGTYYSEESKGIYHASFDSASGRMTKPELFYEARNAKWVSLNGYSMVFPTEKQGCAGACFLEVRNGKVNVKGEILEEKQTPCYILQKDDYVYTANYHEGNVMVYHLEEGIPSLAKRIENGNGAGCHQILLHEDWLMVPCLTQNRIRLFDTRKGFSPAGVITFPDGTGPRHGVFNRNHTRLYVVSEWSNQLFIFQVHGREFTLIQSLSVLPDDGIEKSGVPAAAAIRLTKDERFLYISVRGADILTVFELESEKNAEKTLEKAAAIQYISCSGAHPRDFILDENERFILAVNRFKGGIVSLERDTDSGLLSGIRHRVSMAEGVSLTLAGRKQEEIE